MYSYGPPHMAVQKQDDQHGHTFSNYVRIRDVVQKTYLRRWTIGKCGERGSGISVLPARHDDDDDDIIFLIIWSRADRLLWLSLSLSLSHVIRPYSQELLLDTQDTIQCQHGAYVCKSLPVGKHGTSVCNIMVSENVRRSLIHRKRNEVIVEFRRQEKMHCECIRPFKKKRIVYVYFETGVRKFLD